jgi:hypothetical protein
VGVGEAATRDLREASIPCAVRKLRETSKDVKQRNTEVADDGDDDVDDDVDEDGCCCRSCHKLSNRLPLYLTKIKKEGHKGAP